MFHVSWRMIYFLYGPDTYRSRAKLREIIDAHQKKSGGVLGFTRIDAEEDDLLEKLPPHSATLFRQKTLVVIENALAAKKDYTKLIEARGSAWKDDALTIIIFWEHEIPEKRKTIAGFLKKNSAKTQEFLLPDRAIARRLITEEAKKRDIALDRETTEALLSLGGDSWRVVRELEKYEFAKNFQRSIMPDIKPYHLMDAVIEGRRDAMRMWYILKKTSAIHDILLLGIFINTIRGMLLLKSASNGNERARVAREEGMPGFVAEKLTAQSERFSLDELKKIYQRLFTADISAKTGSLPADSIVMRVVETGLRFDIPLNIGQ